MTTEQLEQEITNLLKNALRDTKVISTLQKEKDALEIALQKVIEPKYEHGSVYMGVGKPEIPIRRTYIEPGHWEYIDGTPVNIGS